MKLHFIHTDRGAWWHVLILFSRKQLFVDKHVTKNLQY